MSGTDSREHSGGRGNLPPNLVYVMPDQALVGYPGSPWRLRDIFEELWRGKWVVVAVTAIFAVSSIVYALAATEWYRAEVLLSPANSKSTMSIGGDLGGLAALAGVTVGGGDTAKSLATLRSREFTGALIEELGLLPILFADLWDEKSETWTPVDPRRWPDVRDGIRYFQRNVLSVAEDRRTSVVTVAVQWKDPDLASSWADHAVKRLNERLRDRALEEAERNVAYLQQELGHTSLVTLQQSIGRLLESELQKVMLARGNDEFAFHVIDPAGTPKYRSRPRRALIVLLGTMSGLVLSVAFVFLGHAVRLPKATSEHRTVAQT